MSKLNLSSDQLRDLKKALPEKAIKPHPTKKGMSTIKPWAVYERMNEVFGVGGWSTTKEIISCEPFVQTTKSGPRDMWDATARVTLHIGDWQEEYFGGSQNDDRGDAMKGATTDALTTLCALHLGIGVYVWQDLNEPYDAEKAAEDARLAKEADELAAKEEADRVALAEKVKELNTRLKTGITTLFKPQEAGAAIEKLFVYTNKFFKEDYYPVVVAPSGTTLEDAHKKFWTGKIEKRDNKSVTDIHPDYEYDFEMGLKRKEVASV